MCDAAACICQSVVGVSAARLTPPALERRVRRAEARKTMTSTTHSTATAAGTDALVQPTPGCRALVTATAPKQMAVRDAPIVSRETR
jgi:hypothetical protein